MNGSELKLLNANRGLLINSRLGRDEKKGERAGHLTLSRDVGVAPMPPSFWGGNNDGGKL
jgi:hypothetical protein